MADFHPHTRHAEQPACCRLKAVAPLQDVTPNLAMQEAALFGNQAQRAKAELEGRGL